ncbi:hypothetical protein [Luteolibacter soli]|uniref:Uncharacterized protein n=1 Tax=Luteolibacter soli TaxID=3135280 RepID=A0ABU9B1L6_9BACT
MPATTVSRQNLVEAALELLQEESSEETSIDVPISSGETLHIDVRKKPVIVVSSERANSGSLSMPLR